MYQDRRNPCHHMVRVDAVDGEVANTANLSPVFNTDDLEALTGCGDKVITQHEFVGVEPAALVVDPERVLGRAHHRGGARSYSFFEVLRPFAMPTEGVTPCLDAISGPVDAVTVVNQERGLVSVRICQTVVNPLVANISPLTSATGPGHQDIHRLPYRPAQNRPKPSLLDGNREHEPRLHWTHDLRSEIFSSVAHKLSPSTAHLYSGIVSKSIPFPLP